MKRNELRMPYPAHVATMDAWRAPAPMKNRRREQPETFWGVMGSIVVTGLIVGGVIVTVLSILKSCGVFHAAIE